MDSNLTSVTGTPSANSSKTSTSKKIQRCVKCGLRSDEIDNTGDITFYNLPKDEAKRNLWIKSFGITRKGRILNDEKKICSLHFDLTSFAVVKQMHTNQIMRILKEIVIPSTIDFDEKKRRSLFTRTLLKEFYAPKQTTHPLAKEFTDVSTQTNITQELNSVTETDEPTDGSSIEENTSKVEDDDNSTSDIEFEIKDTVTMTSDFSDEITIGKEQIVTDGKVEKADDAIKISSEETKTEATHTNISGVLPSNETCEGAKDREKDVIDEAKDASLKKIEKKDTDISEVPHANDNETTERPQDIEKVEGLNMKIETEQSSLNKVETTKKHDVSSSTGTVKGPQDSKREMLQQSLIHFGGEYFLATHFIDRGGSALFEHDYTKNSRVEKLENGAKLRVECIINKPTQPQTNVKLFKCDTCGKEFVTKEKLQSHIRIHTEPKQYKCDFCGKEFSRGSHLTMHVRIHTGEKPFHCHFCGRDFARKEHLQKHIRVHTGEKPLSCPVCRKRFNWPNSLQRHIRTHTGHKRHKCDICGKEITQLYNFKIHLLKHAGNKPFKCNVCEKKFVTKSTLRIHSRIHSRQNLHKCETCGKEFARKQTLETHYLIHSGEKPYKCDSCGKGFVQKEHLQRHLNKPPAEKRFKCDICGKAFTQKVHLQTHHRVHTGQRPFKCTTCGKDFTQKGGLQAHIRVHTGEKPYTCGICNKNFVSTTTLNKHARTHTGEKPYKCQTCGKDFAQSGTLKIHLRVHTGEKPYKCELCGKAYTEKKKFEKACLQP